MTHLIPPSRVLKSTRQLIFIGTCDVQVRWGWAVDVAFPSLEDGFVHPPMCRTASTLS
ncbi:MAG: hypothetical protein JO215_01690 [Ktedonobacteraceae bacterium]|nr:hypothetical protein [Ktedonobacteraceae bacterium]